MGTPSTDTPRQNRVDPWGELVADPSRGSLMGNRGVLHDEHRRIRRFHSSKAWITCLLDFKGRRRQIMRPNHYTELFFLDEATALAAGHRPCWECRRPRYHAFVETWITGNPEHAPGGTIRAPALDAVLHRERQESDGSKVLRSATLAELPDGVLVVESPGPESAPQLLWSGQLWKWSFAGYSAGERAHPEREVWVLTPRSTVNAIRSGYVPEVSLPVPQRRD